MNIPRFTAESSLYKLEGSHAVARVGSCGEAGIAIEPQPLSLYSSCSENFVGSGCCMPCSNGEQQCFRQAQWCCWRGFPFHITCGPSYSVYLGKQPCNPNVPAC